MKTYLLETTSVVDLPRRTVIPIRYQVGMRSYSIIDTEMICVVDCVFLLFTIPRRHRLSTYHPRYLLKDDAGDGHSLDYIEFDGVVLDTNNVKLRRKAGHFFVGEHHFTDGKLRLIEL